MCSSQLMENAKATPPKACTGQPQKVKAGLGLCCEDVMLGDVCQGDLTLNPPWTSGTR